jgi:ribosomal protein S18 acetylase RimI-like enzyme
MASAGLDQQPLTWRAPTLDDVPALRAIHEAVFPVSYEDSFFLTVAQGLDGTSSLLALSGDALVGFVTVRRSLAGEDDLLAAEGCSAALCSREVLYVLTLGVHADWRRRGIAGSLMRALLKLADECERLSLVYLHVLPSNEAALELYRRHGFTVARLERDFYAIDGQSQPALCLCLYLNGGRPPALQLLAVILRRAAHFASSALAALSFQGRRSAPTSWAIPVGD